MSTERQRLLTLALETLVNRRNQIDEEISLLSKELEAGRSGKATAAVAKAAPKARLARKRKTLSKEERLRRSQRMKAYWDNWRKKKGK